MDLGNITKEFDISKIRTKEQITKSHSQCLVCGKNISDRRNLVRHLRNIHCVEPVVRKPQLKCSFSDDCSFLCATNEFFREHLQKAHGFHIVKKVLNFKSKADFENWKLEEEKSTNARYVAYTGTKCRGSRKIYYLRCHRSGPVRCESNASQRKRSKPSKGYTQCGATCPSSIRVAETDSGNVQVVYYPVHLGHSLDDESIPYMKLSTKEKEEIVGKLAQGEPVGKIVSDARKSKGTKLSRINLLQRRDVYNIKKNVNYLEKETDHDGREIDAWVKMLNLDGLQCNPIVLYNPIHETHGYCLILIHYIQKIMYSLIFDRSIVYVKTKKGKPNIDFNLVALSVVCENGDSYPIAFCICQKTEYIILYTFFKIIYQSFGMIKSQIFVSDNISHYYLAWKNVMGECDNKLICTFDIESYWEQKLTVLKCPLSKQKAAISQLKLLLKELDKDVFENELLKVLTKWEKDDDMKMFANFFRKFYVKKRHEWATCYRIYSARKESINQYLEPINNALNSIYEGSYYSVQNALNFLLSFVRDVCLLKLLRWDKQAVKEKLQETKKIHDESLRITQVRCTSEFEWVVEEKEFGYIVKKIENDCDKKCGIFCEACDICTHNYNCICSDYVTGFNICKHLHAVKIFSGKTKLNDLKDFVTVALRSSAVTMAKSLATELESSNLSQEEYNRVITAISTLKEGNSKNKNSSVRMELSPRSEEMSLKILKNSDKNQHECNVSSIVCLNDEVIWKSDLNLVSEVEAPGGILSMAVCDSILFTCSVDETIQSWDLKSMKNIGKISSTLIRPLKLFVDPTTKFLWAGDSQGNVAKYENGKECGKFELVEEIWDLMVTSNPNLVYTARDRDVVVSEIVSRSDKTRVIVKSTLQGRSPFYIAGNYFCFLSREGRNIKVHENNVEKQFPLLKEIVSSDLIINAMAGAGGDVVYVGGYDSTVKNWDLKRGNCLGSVNLGCCINALACRSENEVYVARSDGFITKIGI